MNNSLIPFFPNSHINKYDLSDFDTSTTWYTTNGAETAYLSGALVNNPSS